MKVSTMIEIVDRNYMMGYRQGLVFFPFMFQKNLLQTVDFQVRFLMVALPTLLQDTGTGRVSAGNHLCDFTIDQTRIL